MLWIILWLGLMLLTAIVAGVASWRDWYAAADFLWVSLPLTFVLGFIAVMGLNMWFDSKDRIPEDRYTTLYSMSDAIGTEGHFFLGSGSINTSPVYTYYWQDGDRFRLAWVDASDAYITYSNETPTLVHHGTRQSYSWWFSIGEDDWRVPLNDYDVDPYEFRVPKGSIMQNFNLDAQ